MVKLILFCFFVSNAFAIDGTITALEAPLFAKPDDKSKVIQYVRKGHTVYIHNADAARDDYQDMTFTRDINEFTLTNRDEFITDESIYIPKADSKFYKTLAKSGREAYILKEHVFIEYRDSREMTQKVTRPDNTDYRIEEPLGKNYPLVTELSGYRGQTSIALGQPNYQSYPYKQAILDTSFDLVKEFNFTYSKVTDFNYNQRLYFGALGGIHFSEQQYVLDTQIAKQANSRIYLGPYLSYDFFRNESVYMTFYTSIQFVLFDTMEISINDSNSGDNEKRVYQSPFSLAPNIGANMSFPKSIFEFDGVIGFNIKGLLPKTYTATTGGSETSFWRQTNNEDSFKQPFRVELSYFFGIQSNY